MKNFYKILIILLMILFGVSCEKEIEFKGAEIRPKIVFYSNLQSDSIISCQIALSYAVFEANYNPSQIKNAEVKLYKNNELLENLTYTEPANAIVTNEYEKNYFSNYTSSGTLPDPQSEYKFEVSIPGYNSIQCITSLPKLANNISFDTTMIAQEYIYWDYYADTQYIYKHNDISVKIKFSDPPNEENFYRLKVNQQIGRYNGNKLVAWNDSIPVIVSSENSWISTNDPLLNPSEEEDLFGSSDGNEFMLFSDEKIAGKTYELSFRFSRYGNEIDTVYHEFIHYDINLQSISKDLYYYLNSYSKHKRADGEFLVEPVLVYSNIENGLGVFGAASNTLECIKYGQYPVDGVHYLSEEEYWSVDY